MRWVVGGLAAAALLAATFTWGQAQGQMSTEERVTALEQRVSRLEQTLAAQPPAAPPACLRRDGAPC